MMLHHFWNTKHGQLRLSIELKILIAMFFVAIVGSAIIASVLVRYSNQDKVAYIQDLNSDIAKRGSESLRLALLQYQEEMQLFIRVLGMQELSKNHSNAVVKNIFDGFEDMVFLTITVNGQKVFKIFREEFIKPLGVAPNRYIEAQEKTIAKADGTLPDAIVARNSTCKLGFPTFLLSVPFKVDNASAPIVVTAEIRMEKLLSIVSRASGFESYVVDAEGKVLVHPDEQFVFSRKDFSDLEIVQGMHLTGPRLPIAGTMEFSGYRDETYLGSYSPVGFAHLGMIVQKPKRAAYLAARELTRKSLISALLIILIATGVSFVFSRRLTGPIKKLSAETRRIAQGNFNVKLDIKSRDEIGDLASTFRDMAADLSAREKELKETFQQLAQSEKLAAIGQIGAGITHEIKNPLTGIIGFAQFSQRKLQEPAVVKKNLLIIEKEAKRCKEILENLLKFSRKEKTVFEPTDLNEIVLETIKLIDHQMGINNVRVKVKLESGIPRIMGNANQLQQVFMNMLINAQQAMEGGGEIVVTTTLVEDKAVISFRDTGKGIAQEELNRIFEPFYTTKGKGKGTGLGLTVSYGIIQQHKGRITVESEAGKGTNFCIALPASASEAVSQDPAELPAHISVAAPGTSADTVH